MGATMTDIAVGLGRSTSTVSREIRRNGGPDGYKSWAAQQRAECRAKRPKLAKLAQPGRLGDYVRNGLAQRLSPEQIVCRLKVEFPGDKEMVVCVETIYQSIYVAARGGLKREVDQVLRRGRTYRKPRRCEGQRRARIQNMVGIADRPPEVEDRHVPGHWEGDLIIGRNSKSAISTLVERSTRFLMLGYLPRDHTADSVAAALIPLVGALPAMMRRSLTWDQGSEMSGHLKIADEADIDIYFCDAHSPWQRATNENTNGLLRQYFPKGTDLSVHTPEHLAAVATQMNRRPRKVLNFLTPAEAYALLMGQHVQINGRDALSLAPDWLKQACQAARTDC
jgi:IS30 family transposase